MNYIFFSTKCLLLISGGIVAPDFRAYGFSRLIREVILFPMNQRAEDLMMNAPSEVRPEQLRELHIRPAPPPQRKDG